VIGSGLSRKVKGGKGQKKILGRGIEFVIWKGFEGDEVGLRTGKHARQRLLYR
jgi:hypothetical protein